MDGLNRSPDLLPYVNLNYLVNIPFLYNNNKYNSEIKRMKPTGTADIL